MQDQPVYLWKLWVRPQLAYGEFRWSPAVLVDNTSGGDKPRTLQEALTSKDE